LGECSRRARAGWSRCRASVGYITNTCAGRHDERPDELLEETGVRARPRTVDPAVNLEATDCCSTASLDILEVRTTWRAVSSITSAPSSASPASSTPSRRWPSPAVYDTQVFSFRLNIIREPWAQPLILRLLGVQHDPRRAVLESVIQNT